MNIPLWLRSKFACPDCRGILADVPDGYRCTTCERLFPQPRDFVRLFSKSAEIDQGDWQQRLMMCDDWYSDLAKDEEAATEHIVNDYRDYVETLNKIGGDVLDVGGGAGVPRLYLKACNYVTVEPSLEWLAGRWDFIQKGTSFGLVRPQFVNGMAESLPFQDQCFDAVLMMYSLNHVGDPRKAISEAARVLRPGGQAFLVLEDMEPTWGDLASFRYTRKEKLLLRTALSKGIGLISRRPWPINPDHIKVSTEDMKDFCRGKFRVKSRSWANEYFVAYELTRA